MDIGQSCRYRKSRPCAAVFVISASIHACVDGTFFRYATLRKCTFVPARLLPKPPPPPHPPLPFIHKRSQVVSIRDQLLGEDCTGCLQLLMRYPPDQSVSTVISLSLWVQALANSDRQAQPQSSPAVTFGGEVPLERQLESARVRLNRAGREAGAGGVSVYSPSTSQSAVRAAERRRSGSGAGGGRGGGGRPARPVVRDQRLESERETKNNWQQGLDDFTRR